MFAGYRPDAVRCRPTADADRLRGDEPLQADGGFGLHVFHKHKELAGYCSGLHVMQPAGDVFGNGMLRSRHTKLLAAFAPGTLLVDVSCDEGNGGSAGRGQPR